MPEFYMICARKHQNFTLYCYALSYRFVYTFHAVNKRSDIICKLQLRSKYVSPCW